MKPKYISKAVLTFYNALTAQNLDTVYLVPVPALRVLLLYDDNELYRPEILRLLRKGLSLRDVCRILGVSLHTVRTVSEKHL